MEEALEILWTYARREPLDSNGETVVPTINNSIAAIRIIMRLERWGMGSEKIKIENLKDLSEIFEKREEINGISRSIPNETILNKGCNLDILNYVFKTKEKVDLEKLKQKKINSFDLMKKSSNECDDLINKYLEEIN